MQTKSKTMLNRLFRLSFVLLLILATAIPTQFPVYASNSSAWIDDAATGFTYDSTGVIWAYAGSATNLVIPAKLGKATIKKIGSSVFTGNENLKTVTISNGLTEIGDNAFNNCTSLTSVKFPATLQNIDDYAFDSCSALTNIVLPNGIKRVGAGAFLFCKSITSINLPSSLTTLGTGAFQGISITSVTIPGSISFVPGALFGQTLLKTVVIPATVKTIEGEAFAECPELTSITIPKTVTKIGHNAFKDCPLVKVYGENGSTAQTYSANYNIPFVETAAPPLPTTPVVKPDAIVIPTPTNGATVLAKPSKTQISVNNVIKPLEAYAINGQDYFKLTDLGIVLAGTEAAFTPAFDVQHSLMQLNAEFEPETTPVLSLGDGKEKQARRIYPRVFKGTADISGAVSVYSINGADYYRLSDILNIINCGVIKNAKTGVLNLNPRLSYEPLNSPVFAAAPTGNAAYVKTQKALYNAYLKGIGIVDTTAVTVPDNTTLYVPRGVILGDGGNGKITLGNNSSFIVKGEWQTEYPTRSLKAASASTKNALYAYKFDPTTPTGMDGANNNVVFVSASNNFEWGNLPLSSASLSYSNVSNGVQPIILNVTRDKRDPETCVFVYFHVKGGESFGYLYSNVNESVDLTPQLAATVAKNLGRNAVIDRLSIQNANGVSFSKDISLPVNWTITTSGPAPTDLKPVIYSSIGYGNSLTFDGLTANSYIARYLLDNVNDYQVISSENRYTVAPVQYINDKPNEIQGTAANISLFTGKKLENGKDAYAFVASPFSDNISYLDVFGE